MNTERSYKTKAVYKKGKFIMYDKLQKLILWYREIPNEIVFLRRLHIEKNDEAFGELVISKDGSPAVRIDEVKASKFLMETKNF